MVWSALKPTVNSSIKNSAFQSHSGSAHLSPKYPPKSAKASLIQISSHQVQVIRFPVHWCCNSWAITEILGVNQKLKEKRFLIYTWGSAENTWFVTFFWFYIDQISLINN